MHPYVLETCYDGLNKAIIMAISLSRTKHPKQVWLSWVLATSKPRWTHHLSACSSWLCLPCQCLCTRGTCICCGCLLLLMLGKVLILRGMLRAWRDGAWPGPGLDAAAGVCSDHSLPHKQQVRERFQVEPVRRGAHVRRCNVCETWVNTRWSRAHVRRCKLCDTQVNTRRSL